jgi:hypothetical protein
VADDKRQFNRLAFATAFCLVMTFGLLYMVELPDNKSKTLKADSPKQAIEEFQGKKVVVSASGSNLIAHDDKSGEDIVLVPTGTSSVPHFPKTIRLPGGSSTVDTDDTEYTLIGLGIRTVSFLRVQVYVLGFYVQTSSLAQLQNRFIKRVNPIASTLIPGEKDELRKALLDPEESHKIWDDLLKDPSTNISSAIRIVPTRNTDFRHMLDGWVRGITNRTQAAAQQGDKQYSDETFATSVKSLMDLFAGKGKTPKGEVLLLTRDGKGKFGVLYQDKSNKSEDFGTVSDERIARLIWLGYLGGKGVSSESARQNIVEGIIEMVERPVGTVSTKVDVL